MWPFKKKPNPPLDLRDWNDDWKVGDTAECIVDGITLNWSHTIPPWERPAFREQLIVKGFSERTCREGHKIAYFLHFQGKKFGMETRGFRKVRPIEKKAETNTSIKDKILKPTKVGPDRVREPQPLELKDEWIMPS